MDKTDLLAQDDVPKLAVFVDSAAMSAVLWNVRGNCEAEVDQMVLDFPCMADYNILFDKDPKTWPCVKKMVNCLPVLGSLSNKML